jgi:hypothetical protein
VFERTVQVSSEERSSSRGEFGGDEWPVRTGMLDPFSAALPHQEAADTRRAAS